MSASQEKELDVLIRARYPMIYLVSWEEARAEAMLARLAQSQGKQIYFWSLTRGLCDLAQACNPGLNEPSAVLDYVQKSSSRALFVFKDLHPHMQEPIVVRRLRDLIQTLKPSGKTVILLSPRLTVPMELEKDLTVVDYDLPGPPELHALLDEITQAAHTGSGFQIDLTPEQRDRLLQAIQGLTLTEAESVLAKAIVLHSKLDLRALEVILQEIKQIIRKSRMLEYYEAQEAFANIGGLDTLKEWVRQRGHAFSAKARDFGLPEPRGVLLLGVQGCGKSMTCKAISGLWKLPLLRLDMGSIFGGYIGQSEENMRRAIKTAESVAPCVLWLDEIEKGLAGTQSSNMSDAGTTARVFSTFLTWLQEKSKPVFIAATANNIQMLPPELLRKGRLDEIFFIDLPKPEERRVIFAIHLEKRKRLPDSFDLETLAQLSDGFSGAEIEQVVVAALYDAFQENRELLQEHLLRALERTVPLSRTMKDEIDSLRQWAKSRTRPASQGEAGNGSGAPMGFNIRE
jgi:ATP-dependent 26S proteasome regulatory subunit